MSITPELYLAASQLINHEANCLDRRQWNEWLGLYTEDCVYWVPSWKNEEETVSDPEVSLNLMYLKGRESLGDRVYRIESRDSFASVPLDRTSHVVGTLHVTSAEDNEIRATANFIVHSYGLYGPNTRGGLYDLVLTGPLDALKIAYKKITLLDDRLETPVDIYHI